MPPWPWGSTSCESADRVEFTLLFAAGTGIGAAWAINRLRRSHYPEWLHRPTDLLVGVAAVGMIVGRLASMVAAGVNPVTHPFDILLVRGGVDTAIASIGSLGALAWTSRDHLPMTFDLLAPAVVAGLAGWHAGCLWRGTCLGTATDLPWGMAVEGSSVLRHPVELYTAAAMIVAAVTISRLPARPLLATGAGLTAVAAARLFTEPLRLTVVGGPVAVYLAGTAIGIVLMAVSIFRRPAED